MALDLQIIGAGFGRTGTDSMRTALEMLGFAPCHHMRSVIGNAAHRDDWKRCIESGRMDWDRLLGGCRACVDWPSSHYWRELMNLCPEAKILLTWRTAESWWRSFERTILPAVLDHEAKGQPTPGSLVLRTGNWAGVPLEKDACIAAYEANVAAVKESVPAERLLIHKIGDGWAPLCAFLGVPVPDAPYPSGNTAEDFQKWATR